MFRLPSCRLLSWIAYATFALLSVPGRASATNNPWSQIKTPASGQSESIGGPSAGCLRGARALSDPGTGYVLMRPKRGRNYGHSTLIDLLQQIASELRANREAPLLIGDLGMPRGGPTLSAHNSHQTGLDADIWYFRPKKWLKKTRFSISEREKLSAPMMVDKRKLVVSRAFGDAQKKLLRRFAENEQVDRILVHFTIKRELCQHHANEPWIRKIRPWFGHDHHFHVRMKCSEKDVQCKTTTDPIPEGNSCDATLDWWWSAEARAKENENLGRQQNPIMPELPQACLQVLSM